MKDGLKIAISGKSGCGNTSVSRIVAERLGFTLINYTFHTMAEEKGISFRELHRRAEEDPSYDKYLDKKQVELASEGNCVLGSRLAVWMLEDADLKVFLTAPLPVRAERIRQREGGDPEEVLRETRERDEKDSRRYKNLYGIDNSDFGFADLVIDVVENDQYETAEKIIAAAKRIE